MDTKKSVTVDFNKFREALKVLAGMEETSVDKVKKLYDFEILDDGRLLSVHKTTPEAGWVWDAHAHKWHDADE